MQNRSVVGIGRGALDEAELMTEETGELETAELTGALETDATLDIETAEELSATLETGTLDGTDDDAGELAAAELGIPPGIALEAALDGMLETALEMMPDDALKMEALGAMLGIEETESDAMLDGTGLLVDETADAEMELLGLHRLAYATAKEAVKRGRDNRIVT